MQDLNYSEQHTYRLRLRYDISKSDGGKRDKNEIKRCSKIPSLQGTVHKGHHR